MKLAKTSSSKARTGERKAFARSSDQVRRRTTGIYLRALKGRAILSTTTMRSSSNSDL